jgi:type I restriction enzyme S subunit
MQPLSGLGNIQTGSTPLTSEGKYWGGDYPFVTPAELDQNFPISYTPRTLSNEGAQQSRLLQEGAVMVCCIGSLGKIGIAGRSVVTNQQINSIEFDEKKVFPKFGFYACQRLKPKLVSMAPATTIPIVSKSKFGQLEIPVPPLPEQRRIAAILDQVDAIRAKRREALAQLDCLTQSIFIEMFGDPVTNPMGWEVKKLKEISKSIVNGTTPNGGSQVYVSDGIVFIRSQNVWKNSLLLDDVAFIDNETHLKMRKSSLQNKDILITKTGRINTENSSLGRAAIFIGKDNSANINGHVYLIRLEKGSIHEFVLYILTTDEYREYIRSVCVGGIDKRQINKEHLEEFPIIFPPVDLQHRFATLVESIEKQKGIYRAQLAELDNLFASFQHRAFRGEL